MKPSIAKKYRQRSSLEDILSKNSPALMLGIELPFIVVSGVSLKNAAALSAEMLLVHMLTILVAWVLPPKLRRWQRAILVGIVSTVTMVFAREVIITMFPTITNFVRLHLFLIAFNGMTLLRGIFLRRDAKFGKVMKESFANVIIFAVAMFVISAIREYLSRGTLWGISIPIPFKISGTSAPFFGFILLAFLLVIARSLYKWFIVWQMGDRAKRDTPYTQI